MRHLAIALVIAVVGWPIHSIAQSDAEKARSQLQQLEKDIAQINREIGSANKQRDSIQDALREADLELAAVQRDIDSNQQAIAAQERQLNALREEQQALERARLKQQSRIALEMQTAWKSGAQSQLKMLLSLEEPETVARSMAYYRYFFDARSQLINRYRDTLKDLDQVKVRIDKVIAQLQEKRQQLDTQQLALQEAREKQQAAMAEVLASIKNKAAALRAKVADREELEQLVKAIEEAVEKLVLPSTYQAFSTARGKMPWPLNGKRSNRFGRSRNEGKMRWDGVNIPAREGASVTAIHHGRVVYADWFRGSGLLLIVDHGDGYMSLYAHNQTLLKDVGEWVNTGTPISTVGNSGGQSSYGLYFEIRKDGKPQDPARWCRG